MTKVMVVAGESSGDLHGAGLASALFGKCPGIEVFGAGGARMASVGVEVLVDMTAHAVVGVAEVVKDLKKFMRAFGLLRRAMRVRRPDVVVLIDLPDFNIRLGRVAKTLGIPVVYYISPQVWAWRSWRVRQIAQIVDKMLVILDFEEDLYRRVGVDVTFVGHPLLDVVDSEEGDGALRERLGLSDDEILVGLLPGSRKKELASLLPTMLSAAEELHAMRPETRFAVSCAPGVSYEMLKGLCDASPVRPAIVAENTYELMRESKLILVASGTATLEAAIVGTPMVVVYRVSPVTWCLAIAFMSVSDYGLVNIVAGKRVVPELMQWKAQSHLVAEESLKLLEPERQEEVRAELRRVKRKLGEPGASLRAADEVLSLIENRKTLEMAGRS
jgi:lipid-A-disaccharide synthase